MSVVTAHAETVDFVDENDARGLLSCLVEDRLDGLADAVSATLVGRPIAIASDDQRDLALGCQGAGEIALSAAGRATDEDSTVNVVPVL